jgi:hypothetical protein
LRPALKKPALVIATPMPDDRRTVPG